MLGNDFGKIGETMKEPKKVRYAVVGLGWISQIAVLPAFKHSKSNTELTALVSGDEVKLKKLGKKYGVKNLYHYEQYEECLKSGEIDAVYIALPNSMHREYTVKAAKAGIHVLCEKPMAVTHADCEEMISACQSNEVRLMIAYRLHFEKANLKASEIVKSGKIGEVKYFTSAFSFPVREGDIRVKGDLGGGPLLDVGIYCINAARSLFQEEPIEVTALTGWTGDRKFTEVEEMVSAIMRFPGDKLATFTCSHAASSASFYEVVGSKGSFCLDPAYGFYEDLELYLTIDDKTKTTSFKKRDQFAPELIYFSDCILKNKDPEPSGLEGANDVRIIEAIFESAKKGRSIKLKGLEQKAHPSMKQEKRVRFVKETEMIHARDPEAA
jgi:predicted dehydrogenase